MNTFALPLIVAALAAASAANAADPCADRTVPATAAALGYTERVIDVCPKPEDISPDGNGRFKLYNGHWWENKRAPLTSYRQARDGLAIGLEGSLTTISPKDNTGALPTLAGNRGFYVEFEAYLTDNNPDHWPALWLMPREHNGVQEDSYPPDPPRFERWMELDVDEGGFAPGWLGTVHSWTGIWPDIRTHRNPYSELGPKLDRTKPHVFSAAYDPDQLKVTWWLDGERINEAGPPYVPEVARKQNFYLIMSTQSHAKNLPYDMIVRRFRAFVPPR